MDALRILAVEDNPADFRLLQEYLREVPGTPFEVVGARTMREALEILATGGFAAVLLDLGLPDCTGLAGLDRIAASAPTLPVIVLTGLQDAATGLLALSKNAQDYLVKGRIDSDALVRSIRYAIERKRAGEAIVQAKREWERTFDTVPDLIAILDDRHRMVRVNRAMARRLGRMPQECIGAACHDLVHGCQGPPDVCPHAQTLKDGREHTAEVHEPRLGGDFLVTTTPLRDAEGRMTGSVHVARDITDRKRSEMALAVSRRRAELLAEIAGRLLATPAPQQALEELCRKVMVFLDCQVFFNFLVVEAGAAVMNPGHAPAPRGAPAAATAPSAMTDEAAPPAATDAAPRPIKRLRLNACAGISAAEARRIEWLDFGVAVCGCVARDGQRILAEDIATTPDPRTELVKSYGIQAYCCHPLTTEGRVIGTLSFGTRDRPHFSADDIAVMRTVADLVSTAMARMQTAGQLRRTAEDLTRSNRDLEQFAYVASHDLQEPLRMVAGFGDLLQARYGDVLDARGREYVQHLVANALRMRALVEGLLEYSRAGRADGPVQPVFAQAALEIALANLQAAVTEGGAVVTADLLPRVRIEREHLTQVFQNLIGNALKFRDPQRPVKIHVGARMVRGTSWVMGQSSLEKESGDAKVSSPMTHDEQPGAVCWLFTVRDNGIGIDPQFRERIFVIFQRLHTREEHPGAGLGLAICKKIVERRGGRIWVESEQGQGATFCFTVPE